MRYLALGDSVSIDEYTGVPGGGATRQLAEMIAADLEDLTYDGCTTAGVLEALTRVSHQPDVVTVTAGGNDLLLYGAPAAYRTAAAGAGDVFSNLAAIVDALDAFHCPVILNTVYDPTDGDDARIASLGLPVALRDMYHQVNALIRRLAREHGFLLADLETLFHGHGMASNDPWLVRQIEPNLAGATAIARCWHALWTGR